jgi:hypothetical protein
MGSRQWGEGEHTQGVRTVRVRTVLVASIFHSRAQQVANGEDDGRCEIHSLGSVFDLCADEKGVTQWRYAGWDMRIYAIISFLRIPFEEFLP